MNYEITLATFKGPLDLLLHLIEKNKIDIYDIPMASLTKQYMDYLNKSQEFNFEVATEFLLMAAKLVHIKSQMILPKARPIAHSSDDTAGVSEDPREELVQRLLEYQKFQRISDILSSMLIREERFIKRSPMKLSQKVLPPKNLSLNRLLKSFVTLMTMKEEPIIPEVLVSSEVFQVKDKMTAILSQLECRGDLKLSEVIKTTSAGEVIATFLALLELIKRHKVTAEQLIPFSDIKISNAM